MSQETNDNLNEILQLRKDKLINLQNNNRDPFQITKYDVDNDSKNIELNFDELQEKQVSLAGRIMLKRGQGKVSFYDLQDNTGRIQLFLKKDSLGEDLYNEIKTLDIGDIVGVKGEVFKTKMGQISIRVQEIILLCKSLQILPEKFHGLKDPDLRYRQRYVDLIMDTKVREVFVTRSLIQKYIRTFLDDKGFLEVETPVLSTLAGGAAARPFATHHNALDIDMYLRIALELPLKRLIVGGFDKVYEMSRVFRNEGMDATHNPEFTMLETYEAYADYNDVMQMVEELLNFLVKKLFNSESVIYQEKEISLKPPYRKIKMVDLVTEITGVNFDNIRDLEEAYKQADILKLECNKKESIGEIINIAFEQYVEEKLIQPTFVTHHPVEISPLAKKDFSDPRYTERFELFINGAEYANAFSELNDPIDQKSRFAQQMEKKNNGDEEAHPYDKDFINALEVGMPPTGGLGVGIDRLIMLFTDQKSIRDVILFPTMKPEN
ncbi:lysine--tRNA ligase [Alkalibaculum sp. M08DMB]|uniref:Lysine--tRNA ligase n=1 Tax=Alkalibaculum sporogenes TaxID=2655001 RepID=A0A6A7KCU6_9FIRM|nr:lysine--tRNA ligase [Alkalibaculum sporogenes]MPW27172.1 lysine--tRNA ligase [Alkalibaculum sporogenes]